MSDGTADGLVDGLVVGDDGLARCWWCADDELYRDYHDREWGRPVHDDRRLFEKLVLEGFQSGLSWLTILRKREGFRAGFAGFEIDAVAAFDDDDIERLVGDAGIVRHRGKITSAINNARRCREIIADEGSLDILIWRYVPGDDERPGELDRDAVMTMAQTPTSKTLAKELKRRGLSFVGPTTAYAFMQSMGLVNDHVAGCHVRDASGPDGG